MKLSLKGLLLLLIAGVLFSACNKDDDDDKTDPTPTSYLKYDGQTIALTKGFLENYGEDTTDIWQLDLTLLSSGFTIYEVGGEIDSISGTGSGIYFELFTSQPNSLDTRTYTLDTLNIGDNGTFDYGDFVVNFNYETFEGTWSFLESGTLVVVKNGSTYEFTVNGVDIFGKTVQAYYKGSVNYYDYSKKSGQIAVKRNLWHK